MHNKAVVNGVFDLFHAGHEEILHYALKLCYYGEVLVLINSDRSTRELKGEGRPIDSINTRIENIKKSKQRWCLKHLEYPILYIQVFDNEEELALLIDDFEPDVIIKGNDRTDVKDIVGSDKWPVLIQPRTTGKSTTKLLEELDE